MRRSLVIMVVLAAAGIGLAVAYQTLARDREYQTRLARGDAALRDDQTFGAIEEYSGAAALRPDSMLARLRRGETYERRGDLDAAAHDFRAAAALDPTAIRPLEELGSVLYQMGRFDRAAEVFERALKIDDRSARNSYNLALARYRNGDLDGALAVLAGTAGLGDSTAEMQYLLGLCLRDRRLTVAAQQAFERAIALSPGFIPAREELADLYAAQNKRAYELDELQMLAGLDRDHVARQVAVGLAEAQAGREEPAIVTLGTALERTPDQAFVYEALGRIWLQAAEARNDRLALGKALEALERASSNPRATSEALTLYGRALLRDGQLDRAEQTLLDATTRYPLDPSSFLSYAAAAERQNHLDAARRALIDYEALSDDDAQFVSRATRIATLSMRLEDPASAARWLQKAAEARPADTRLLASLGDAQLQAGDRDGARATIARGLDIDPTSAALRALARRLR